MHRALLFAILMVAIAGYSYLAASTSAGQKRD
jgi:hypothetical protein